MSTILRRWRRVAFDFLPKGHSLPEEVWRVRHRTLSFLLRAHVVGLFILGLSLGEGPLHSALEAAIVGAFAVVSWACTARRAFASAVTALGLVVASAVLVHLSNGTIEMHFHFFVMVGILTLYQDWQPFLLAIGFVVLHHGVLGTLTPSAVYNHPAAVAQPLRWALIHGVFVLAASVASVVAWKLNEEQAMQDSLTRLPNRRLFHDRVAHGIARTSRRPMSLAVVYIDLDGFKDVNDSLGHAGGDQLLVLVAERIRALVRPSDTAARIGGDEFAVLVEEIVGEAEARYVAERLLSAMAAPFTIRGTQVVVGASAGIALGEPGTTMEDLLLRADGAMYEAKAAGRGCCRVAGHAEPPQSPAPASPVRATHP
ncbi:MAG TPA: GGDEF domain-containing protein [Acidimicrobiales bacterium]|nr:GGDEF domain-containing protein [Acidimicrobiales bacterium]